PARPANREAARPPAPLPMTNTSVSMSHGVSDDGLAAALIKIVYSIVAGTLEGEEGRFNIFVALHARLFIFRAYQIKFLCQFLEAGKFLFHILFKLGGRIAAFDVEIEAVKQLGRCYRVGAHLIEYR